MGAFNIKSPSGTNISPPITGYKSRCGPLYGSSNCYGYIACDFVHLSVYITLFKLIQKVPGPSAAWHNAKKIMGGPSWGYLEDVDGS